MSAPRQFLGAGVGLRRAHWPDLGLPLDPRTPDAPSAGPPVVRVLELTPSHLFGRPELLELLASRHTLVLHDVLASLGTAGPLDRAHLGRVAELARRCGAIDYSEHLAMTRSPGGIDLGHLVAVPRTRAQLQVLVDHVREVRDILELPVALELPATTIELPGAELDEAAFVSELVERGDCELHLDIENLRVDALNGLPPASGSADAALEAALDRALTEAGLPSSLSRAIARRLAGLPLHSVSRVHLAGGHPDAGGWWVDSHADRVHPDNWAILAALRGRVRPRAIIVERDVRLPPLTDLAAEARQAQRVWSGLIQ